MSIKNDVIENLLKMQKEVPLVHNMTNYVTVNDCANAVLAIGASPIMADDISECADITSISKALVINIGTLNKRTIDSMLASGKRANEIGVPVVFDPVGAGASKLRNDTVSAILDNVKITILRGNLSEVSFIAGLEVNTKGVDSAQEDSGNDAVAVAKAVAKKLECVVAITGAVDVISDGDTVVKISNGHKMLSKVTGTGCMTSALVGAYVGASENILASAVAGVASMGIAGEIAYKKAGEMGTGSFHIAIIDALSNMSAEIIKEMAKFE